MKSGIFSFGVSTKAYIQKLMCIYSAIGQCFSISRMTIHVYTVKILCIGTDRSQ